MLKGITVTLYIREQTGTDSLGAPVYEETAVEVENVLVSPASVQEIIDSTNLYGKKAVYNLAIPKEDGNDWENCRVDFFGKSWRVFGAVQMGIDDLIPLSWNKKVQVENYEF